MSNHNLDVIPVRVDDLRATIIAALYREPKSGGLTADGYIAKLTLAKHERFSRAEQMALDNFSVGGHPIEGNMAAGLSGEDISHCRAYILTPQDIITLRGLLR
jgi:hypothetical protein